MLSKWFPQGHKGLIAWSSFENYFLMINQIIHGYNFFITQHTYVDKNSKFISHQDGFFALSTTPYKLMKFEIFNNYFWTITRRNSTFSTGIFWKFISPAYWTDTFLVSVFRTSKVGTIFNAQKAQSFWNLSGRFDEKFKKTQFPGT